VSQTGLETQDMENNITKVRVNGGHFKKKQHFLCKFKVTKLDLSTTPDLMPGPGFQQSKQNKG
jgi:hypothetical protein